MEPARDEGRVATPRCRFCEAELRQVLVDLGMSPLCESYVPADRLRQGEMFYPLRPLVCSECFLVQLEVFVPSEDIFSEYAYFSSYSRTWVEHAREFATMARARFKLGSDSLVVEVASNDGYLLQHFVGMGIPVLGIEPAANVAKAAKEKGVPTLVRFFGKKLADELKREGRTADLVVGNNVLAQVPDLRDFVSGLREILKSEGVLTLEFPHLVRLMEENQFDTIYHEHFSYFSFTTSRSIFESHGLRVFDVEQLPTHGGSLRCYLSRAESCTYPESPRVHELLEEEDRFGITSLQTYSHFAERVAETKRRLLSLLISLREDGKRIAGYGAPGKGNTLLNYCGIRTDFIEYTVDRNPYKQGKYLPGTRIPIYAPQKIFETRPDYVLILPWNFKDEIMSSLAGIREWGGRFIIPIPNPTIE